MARRIYRIEEHQEAPPSRDPWHCIADGCPMPGGSGERGNIKCCYHRPLDPADWPRQTERLREHRRLICWAYAVAQDPYPVEEGCGLPDYPDSVRQVGECPHRYAERMLKLLNDTVKIQGRAKRVDSDDYRARAGRTIRELMAAVVPPG